MQKTRFGISVGMLGAMMFFTCLFGGYVPMILLAGYILLFEENAWLKRSTVKGVALMVAFSVLSSLIYLIPNAIAFVDSFLNVFGGNFQLLFVSKIITFVTNALDILEKVLFLLLGIKAFNQGSIKIPFIDSLLGKNMD